MEINFYDTGKIDNEGLKFAVIVSKFKDKWVFVKHKDRDTWEIPGGHREIGENINETAKRELFEETGAKDFQIRPICDYSVTRNNIPSYGRLFFSKIEELDTLPDYEIKEVKLFDEIPDNLTYAEIQPYLFEKVRFLESQLDYKVEPLESSGSGRGTVHTSVYSNGYEGPGASGSSICPLCGQDNNCQCHEKECWCYHIEIPKELLELVPEGKKGKSCICKSCIEKYKEENR